MLALLALAACQPEPSGPAPASMRVGPSVPVAPAELGREVEPPASPAPAPSEGCRLRPPAGFVDLGARIPSAHIVAGYASNDNFTGAPLPGYERRAAWLEAGAAEALAEVAAALEDQGLRLIIYDAYRPRRASEAMVAWCRAQHRLDLIDEGWIAPRSAHSRGLAVDLGLADRSGRALDMGTGWDHFGPRSRVHAVEGQALARRLQLRRAMQAAGFEPYAREWWHFRYASGGRSPSRDAPYACRSPL